jgi:membrane protease YdiL (CAAX protease family)
MSKKKIYQLGLITLFVFPIPTVLTQYFFENRTLLETLEISSFHIQDVFNGLITGLVYAILAFLVLQAPIFQKVPLKVDELVKQLKLNYWDAIFLSFCAGVGEELLFRSGIQFYFGVIITSILFVAIHGYFSLKNPYMSLYGLVVLPLSLILGFGFKQFGLWYSISTHFSYDLILFLTIIGNKKR